MSSSANQARPAVASSAFGKSTGNTEADNELRRHRRARAAWPARILDGAGRIIPVTVCDVSEGGVGLLSAAGVTLGTVLDVTLSVPVFKEQRAQAVTAKVRVAFTSLVGAQHRIGVQFVELPMAARIAIRGYVMANC